MRNINGQRDKWKYTGGKTARENYRGNTTLRDQNSTVQYSAVSVPYIDKVDEVDLSR